MEFTRHLSSESRARFERFWRLHAKGRGLIASIFRAIAAGDARQFRERLAALHAGAEARILALILIHRIAQRLDRFPEIPEMHDRLIAAESMALDAPVVTRDEALLASPRLATVW